MPAVPGICRDIDAVGCMQLHGDQPSDLPALAAVLDRVWSAASRITHVVIGRRIGPLCLQCAGKYSITCTSGTSAALPLVADTKAGPAAVWDMRLDQDNERMNLQAGW